MLAEDRVLCILAQNEDTFDNGVTAVTVWSCMGMDHVTGFCQFSALPQQVVVSFSMDGYNWDSNQIIPPDPSGVNLYTWNFKIGSSKFVKVTLQANAGAGATAHFNCEIHSDED